MENKIETAEELINWLESVSDKLPKTVRDHLSINIKGYAKSHVKVALKVASENAKVKTHYPNPYSSEVDIIIEKNSILNAYPEDLIK